MPYQIQPLKEFLVRPALPSNLGRLLEIAYNLVWSWDHTLRALFRRLDPLLWKEVQPQPHSIAGPHHAGKAESRRDRPALSYALQTRL